MQFYYISHMNITPKCFLVLFFSLTSWNTCLGLTHVYLDKKQAITKSCSNRVDKHKDVVKLKKKSFQLNKKSEEKQSIILENAHALQPYAAINSSAFL